MEEIYQIVFPADNELFVPFTTISKYLIVKQSFLDVSRENNKEIVEIISDDIKKENMHVFTSILGDFANLLTSNNINTQEAQCEYITEFESFLILALDNFNLDIPGFEIIKPSIDTHTE